MSRRASEVRLSEDQRRALVSLTARRTTAQSLALRARIVLAYATRHLGHRSCLPSHRAARIPATPVAPHGRPTSTGDRDDASLNTPPLRLGRSAAYQHTPRHCPDEADGAGQLNLLSPNRQGYSRSCQNRFQAQRSTTVRSSLSPHTAILTDRPGKGRAIP